MKSCFILHILLLLIVLNGSAEKILDDLEFNQGDWALVGIPVHNYKMVPIQQELRTFITRDKSFLNKLKESWDFNITFDDRCDYHYALKFYKENKLVKTVMLNLYCGYISANGFAYEFNPKDFESFKAQARPIKWSRISFGDLEVMKDAVKVLDDSPEVFWYDDVLQYTFSGFFMFSLNGIPWNADVDSLTNEVHDYIIEDTGSEDFHLKRYFHLIEGKRMSVRYMVSCEEPFTDNFGSNMYVQWRSHLQNTDSVRIVAIGIDQKRYWQLLNSNQNIRSRSDVKQ